MKKGFTLVEAIVVFVILAILCAVFIPIVSASVTNNDLKATIKSKMEYAYFEGQKDALEGKIKIKKVDSGYVWTESPWDKVTMGNEKPSKDSGSWIAPKKNHDFW